MTAGELNVSRETYARLEAYVSLLKRWSYTHNLIGPAERDRLWDRHVANSLLLANADMGGQTWLDIGTGAGLPGLVLACVFKDVPGAKMILSEMSAKRCAFLRHVARELDLPVEVFQGDVQRMKVEAVDVVTARAVAPLPKLIGLALPWLDLGAEARFLKGKTWEEELTRAQEWWTFQYSVEPGTEDGSGIVLTLREVSRVAS